MKSSTRSKKHFNKHSANWPHTEAQEIPSKLQNRTWGATIPRGFNTSKTGIIFSSSNGAEELAEE